MTIVKWNPRNDAFPTLNNWLENFWGRDVADRFQTWTGNTPAVNIKETETGFELAFAAPGMQKSDFSISLDRNLLTISTEKQTETEQTNDNYVRREFGYQSFRRSFTLPETVDKQGITAAYTDGVLFVRIPKQSAAPVNTVQNIDIA